MDQAVQKKIKSDIKRRETNYKARGYDIIAGSGALDILLRPETHTLLAIDTDYWSSLEYIETNNLINGEDVDFYIFRYLSNGKFFKELRLSNDKSFIDFVSGKKWAVRKENDMGY